MSEVVVVGMLHAEVYGDGAVTLRLGEASIPLTADQVLALVGFLYDVAASENR